MGSSINPAYTTIVILMSSSVYFILKSLIIDPGFSENQKDILRTTTTELGELHGRGADGARSCLIPLQQEYSAGGISLGRSLRSVIMDKLLLLLPFYDNPDATERVNTLLSILVAMYYSPSYMESNDWYDGSIRDMRDLPIHKTALVSAAALALDVDNIVSLEDWSNSRIFEYAQSIDVDDWVDE